MITQDNTPGADFEHISILAQLLLGHTEIVADFVDKSQTYLFDNLIFRIADSLDVFLVKNDGIGQRSRDIKEPSMRRIWGPREQPQQIVSRHPGPPGIFGTREIFHENPDILKAAPIL